ncbi:MAG: hypothetical protein QOF17_207 [Solirubrobacteraceae bacterium]|nr:hypothetical protein [Solirubrobacteraceae bacterium]
MSRPRRGKVASMPLISNVLRLARSPQARRLISQAGTYARSPEGRAKLDQVRRQIAARRGPRQPPR